MTKLINNEITNKVTHGILTIETSKGILKYDYSTGVDYDADYQLHSAKDSELLKSLSDDEQDEVCELITNEIY